MADWSYSIYHSLLVLRGQLQIIEHYKEQLFRGNLPLDYYCHRCQGLCLDVLLLLRSLRHMTVQFQEHFLVIEDILKFACQQQQHDGGRRI